ncbi:MAG: 30S ribosome-binding factor RbfA [Solirubrobacterales bacterium]
MRRVNEAVREVVSSAVLAETKDPRIGFVTVTGVETSPDLRHATVFVSVFGDELVRRETLEGLADSRKILQQEIALHLRMKNTPKLKFVYDETVDRSMRITELINTESISDDAPGQDSADAPMLNQEDEAWRMKHE